MFGPINKKNKKEKNQINKTLKSKFVYEDCFVYDESRFTGIVCTGDNYDVIDLFLIVNNVCRSLIRKQCTYIGLIDINGIWVDEWHSTDFNGLHN